MNDTIIVGIIGGVASVLVGVITYFTARSKATNELSKKIDIANVKLEQMASDIKEHNHYAKLFAETMPVVQEQIKVINHRLSDLEGSMK